MKKYLVEEGLEVRVYTDLEDAISKRVFGIPKDIFGPKNIVKIRDKMLGYEAYLVIDNVYRGPAIGGVRMSPDVTPSEVYRLARTMTKKNAVADIPHGGGKSGIVADPAMPWERKKRVMQRFARAISPFKMYIPGPDMGTDENAMEVVFDEIGRASGLPQRRGGIPVDVLGLTGFGCFVAASVATEYSDFHGVESIENSTVAIQGFGAVGHAVAKNLWDVGAKIVAISTCKGALIDWNGLNIEQLLQLKDKHGIDDSILYYKGRAERLLDPEGRDSIIYLPTDFFIPAAVSDVITTENVSRIKARVIVQGANIPVSADAEKYLHKNKILSIPDYIANAGGVIGVAEEVRLRESGVNPTQIKDKYPEIFTSVETKIKNNTKKVLEMAFDQDLTPREASDIIAWERIRTAMGLVS